MDTNSLAALAAMLSQDRAPDNQSMLLIFGVVATAITSLAGAVIAYFSRGEIVKIHTAVNSERTAMLLEIKTLRDEILSLSQVIVKLQER